MDLNKLTLEEAQLLLVENFLVSRHKPKSLAPELLKKVSEPLSTPGKDFMLSKGIFKSEKAAFINVNALGVILAEIQEKSTTRPITKADCKYLVSPELREDIEIDWGVGLAEDVAAKIEIL